MGFHPHTCKLITVPHKKATYFFPFDYQFSDIFHLMMANYILKNIMEPCLFIKCFIITSTLIVFILKLSQFWPKEALSSWFFCPFHVLPLDRWLSSKILCPRIILYFLSPRSGIISLFSKEPWLLFLGNAFRNQDLTTKCTHCYRESFPGLSIW